MKKSANTADGAVPRSRNRNSDISSGSRSEHASATLAMNRYGEAYPIVKTKKSDN